MAESKINEQSQKRSESQRSTQTAQAPASRQQQSEQESRGMQRWSAPGIMAGPFAMFDRMADEMDRTFDRLFGEFGMPRRSWLSRPPSPSRETDFWTPRVEAFQKGDRYTVRAELPGLKKDDVQVEATSDMLTIQGERHGEHEEEHEGYYHSEREYGRFYRTIPLPDGVIADKAEASFSNGVLEVSMPCAPAQANRGRRLEISEKSNE
jgi:HSP20 family protein